MVSSLRKSTFVPTGTANTWGTKALPLWLMTLPRAGAGRGVSPFARLSQTTAPPGPGVPPPAIVPLTVTVKRGAGEGSAAAGGTAAPAAGAGGAEALAAG